MLFYYKHLDAFKNRLKIEKKKEKIEEIKPQAEAPVLYIYNWK